MKNNIKHIGVKFFSPTSGTLMNSVYYYKCKFDAKIGDKVLCTIKRNVEYIIGQVVELPNVPKATSMWCVAILPISEYQANVKKWNKEESLFEEIKNRYTENLSLDEIKSIAARDKKLRNLIEEYEELTNEV